ncbi:tetratricopeptide repeat protein [Planctobacterium marinum]|uniref:tetratricopeptide repeat protein n=1 Tax=Planctobacterium marinum TaxID=1631968 RepID=UPI001E533FE2|nr:tetratricopeptide repeat protein [Planctobacterium marinum]MCC2604070.1 tetratricopeptide repeat protein [Planctobacterium marinum]
MTKSITIIAIGAILLLTSVPLAFAQSANENRAKAYIEAAEHALQQKDYEQALEAVTKAREFIGRDNALCSSLKVKTLVALGRYPAAQKELDLFYTLPSSQELISEMGRLQLKIDNGPTFQCSGKAKGDFPNDLMGFKVNDDIYHTTKRTEPIAFTVTFSPESKKIWKIKSISFSKNEPKLAIFYNTLLREPILSDNPNCINVQNNWFLISCDKRGSSVLDPTNYDIAIFPTKETGQFGSRSYKVFDPKHGYFFNRISARDLTCKHI